MDRMTTAEATVSALIAHGLDTLYALPGIHNDHLFDALFHAADRIKVVHSRHEQGAAYMALGAALATGKPQAYSVVPGPGLLNTGAALLTAYGMNAPVLALIGQIPERDIGRGFGHLHEIRDQAGLLKRLVDFSAHIRAPHEAAGLVADAFRAMASGRHGPAALECAIDVWGKSGPVRPIGAPEPPQAPPVDDDAVLAAAKLLGKAKRPLIVCGGGAQGASEEVTRLSAMLQAPVLGYRRGRGVLDSRDPLSVTFPLGHELWAEADVVIGVGSRMHFHLTTWGVDEDLSVIRVTADPEEPARFKNPAVALVGDSKPILSRLLDVLPAHNAKRPSRRDDMEGRQAKVRARLAKLGPQLAFLEAIRAELPEDGIFVDEVTQTRLRGAARAARLQAAHVPFTRISGQSRLGLCDRARRAARAAGCARALHHWRRRLPLHRRRTRDRDASSDSAGHRRVRRRRLRQCAAHPGGGLRQPPDRERYHQPGLRPFRREFRRRRRAGAHAGRTPRRPAPRLCTARRADPDRGAGRADAIAMGIHRTAARARGRRGLARLPARSR